MRVIGGVGLAAIAILLALLGLGLMVGPGISDEGGLEVGGVLLVIAVVAGILGVCLLRDPRDPDSFTAEDWIFRQLRQQGSGRGFTQNIPAQEEPPAPPR
jgi:hypothetical protein